MCSICLLRVAPPRGYSRTQIRSNRSSDMSTQTAQVLPFPRHEAAPASHAGRKGVRLEATPRGRIVLTLVAFLLGLLVALGAQIGRASCRDRGGVQGADVAVHRAKATSR